MNIESERKSLNLPQVFSEVWDSRAPDCVSYRFNSPQYIYGAIQENPDAFCKSEQLLPLLEINGTQLIGYLIKDNKYINWAYEDGPNKYEIISANYNGLLGFIFRSYLYSKKPDELREIAKIFNLVKIDELIDFYITNQNWEDEIVEFMENNA